MAEEPKPRRTLRRGNGEGAIYKRKDGRWAAEVTDGYDKNGKRERLWLYARSKGDLLEKLARHNAESLTGALAEPSKLTVAQYLAHWLDTCVRQKVRKNTVIGYTGIVKNHLNPHVGGILLQKLNPAQIQAMMAELEDAGMSARMRQLSHTVLSAALKKAVKLKLLTWNPCQATDKPRAPKKAMQVLDVHQADRLLEASKDDRLHALYVLAVTTGLRQGELLALQWDNVDLKRGTLSVVHTLLDLNGKLELGEPKSARGRRLVQLPELAIEALREHRKKMLAEGHPQPWVFPDSEGGPLRGCNLTRRHFKPLLKQANLPDIRFHDLRHTAATLLLTQDVHPKIVQERLGHATIAVTLDTYSHVLPSMQHQAARKLDELFQARSQT